ncbi:MAG: transposase [Clostridiales bacterium]|nr:transposase [Clostridiales bacterium]MCF8023287.1 transposase [Clostridiales bacterium]
MKKIFLFLMFLLIVIPLNASASQEPPDRYQEALNIANKDLEDVTYPGYFQMQNINGRPFNENLYDTRTLFVYGAPFEDFEGGNYRYLGYTMETDDKELTLSDKTWICSYCGVELDRDINAAINIKNEGCHLLGIA